MLSGATIQTYCEGCKQLNSLLFKDGVGKEVMKKKMEQKCHLLALKETVITTCLFRRLPFCLTFLTTFWSKQFPFKIFNSNDYLNPKVPATQLYRTSLKHRCPKDLISYSTARQPGESDVSVLFQHIRDFIFLQSHSYGPRHTASMAWFNLWPFHFPKVSGNSPSLGLFCDILEEQNN